MTDLDIPNFELISPEEFFGGDETREDKHLKTFLAPAPEPETADAGNENGTSKQRFTAFTEDEMEKFKQKSLNKNTKKTTSTWMNAYRSWANEKGEREDIENISPEQLNLLLERFYAEIRKKDGTNYEPESLGVMQASIDRFLRENNCNFSIVRDPMFTSSRAVLSGKATVLRESGKGTRPNSAKALTWEEEEELWQTNKLGDSSPEVLLHTVWFVLTQHLGFRGCQEHKVATIEEFKFQVDDQGREYISYADAKPTKTRQGGIRVKKRSQKPRMFQTNDERCPVSLFKKYLLHRPLHLLNNGPLYLSINYNTRNDVWYKDQKMGVNRITEIMKRIVSGTTFSGSKKFTNHSGRKTVVKKLDEAAVPRNKIIAVTGHCNEKSLDDYVDVMNNDQSRELSSIISGKKVLQSIENSTALAPVSHAELPPAPASNMPMCQAPALSRAQGSFPVLNLSNINNSTINLSISSPSFAAEAMCSTTGEVARPRKKRFRPFVDSDDSE